MRDQTEKPLAELEAEARQRVQEKSEDKQPVPGKKSGQPQVAALKKRGKNRIVVLCLLAFVVLVILAFVGDRLMSASLKSGKKEQPEPVQTQRPAVKRTDMGMEVNPMGALEDRPEAGSVDVVNAPPPPVPVTFNKTAALAVTSSSPRQNASQSAADVPGTAQGTTYTPCPVLMEKDANGKLYCPDDAKARAAAAAAQTSLATMTTVSRITLNPDLYIPVDTYIPCALLNRFVSTVAGKISCLITEDVYSASRNTRLIPAGTKARGVYQTGTVKQGDARMLVAWTELRTPDGKIIPMVDSQVVGQLGENGIAGWVDNHTWERLYSTILIGMVPDVASALTNTAPGTDRNTDYTENTRAGVAEMAKSMMENSANIAPTIYKNQGEVIGISTGSDIDFSGVYSLRLSK